METTMEVKTRKITKLGDTWMKSLGTFPANPNALQISQREAIEEAIERSRTAIRAQYIDRIVHPDDFALTIQDVLKKTSITINMPFA